MAKPPTVLSPYTGVGTSPVPHRGPDPGGPGRTPQQDRGYHGKGKAGSHYIISIEMDEHIHLVQCHGLQKQPGAKRDVPVQSDGLCPVLRERLGAPRRPSSSAQQHHCTLRARSEPVFTPAGPGLVLSIPSPRPVTSFWGKKGRARGLDVPRHAGVLVGASRSHGCCRVAGGAVAPPCLHHPSQLTEPCPGQTSCAPT